jgi:hypothetical protein
MQQYVWAGSIAVKLLSCYHVFCALNLNRVTDFYVHATVLHRNKFIFNKTNQTH